jgi:hypothetical protein
MNTDVTQILVQAWEAGYSSPATAASNQKIEVQEGQEVVFQSFLRFRTTDRNGRGVKRK